MARLGRGTPVQPSGLPKVKIGFDSSASGFAVGGSVTYSHTISSTANFVLGGFSNATNTGTCSMKVGSTSMTQLGFLNYGVNGAYAGVIAVFYLLNPPTGTQTITVSNTGGVTLTGGTVSYSGVGSIGSLQSNQGTSTPATITQSLKPGQMAVSIMGNWSSGTNGFTSYNQNLRLLYPASPGNIPILMCDSFTSPSATFTAACYSGSPGWGAYSTVLTPLDRR